MKVFKLPPSGMFDVSRLRRRLGALRTDRIWIEGDFLDDDGTRGRYLVSMKAGNTSERPPDHRTDVPYWIYAGREGTVISTLHYTYDRAEADAFFDLLCVTQPCFV